VLGPYSTTKGNFDDPNVVLTTKIEPTIGRRSPDFGEEVVDSDRLLSFDRRKNSILRRDSISDRLSAGACIRHS
jgi:hypothetical protein